MKCVICEEALSNFEDERENTKSVVCDDCYQDYKREIILADHIDVEPTDIEDSYGNNMFKVGISTYGPEYLVLTDDEADELWDEQLDNYLDECVLPELPESARMYFDRDSWKSDARMDGRGHSIASYDGNEDEVQDEDGNYFYIYRTN
jgi:hypothetical protein